ncbi:MAG TPA: lysozyme inhibitor LprI family protein [Brevundimonas sp.]|nr:lysozyme inhibitor LprI family protein [Brevundimonas sp.]
MFVALLAAVLLQSRSDADAAAAAAAQAAVSDRETPFSCVRDGSMPEIKMCAAEDMVAETERMERYLEAARIRASELDEHSVEYGPRTRQAAWLSESQQAWETYAERRCDGVKEATSGGTMGSLGWMGCITEATRQRTHDIWSDYLTYWDTTPPVLPEPVLTVAEERTRAEAH